VTTKPNKPTPRRAKVAGSGVGTTFEVPCIETNSSKKVCPKSAVPPNVIVAGNVRLLICVAPSEVVWPRLSTMEQELNSEAAPPLIWHWPLFATPVPFWPVLFSEKENVLLMLFVTRNTSVPSPRLPRMLGWVSIWRRVLSCHAVPPLHSATACVRLPHAVAPSTLIMSAVARGARTDATTRTTNTAKAGIHKFIRAVFIGIP